MPGFHIDGGTHFVSFITGPSHNILGLKLVDDKRESPLIVAKEGKYASNTFDEAKLTIAVQTGVDRALKDSSRKIYVSEIVYMKDDSVRYDAYEICAGLIVERYLSNPDDYETN